MNKLVFRFVYIQILIVYNAIFILEENIQKHHQYIHEYINKLQHNLLTVKTKTVYFLSEYGPVFFNTGLFNNLSIIFIP